MLCATKEGLMPQLAIPAVFMRGGTSRAVMFHARDLPDRAEWDPIFLAAMGSPDPNGRQLDGMGGGISSLSKICILAPSERIDADIDYTFAQVQIREPRVDYSSNCGNMSSAVGPFAVDEGIVRPNGDTAVVRIFNTNTRKIIRSTFPLGTAAPPPQVIWRFREWPAPVRRSGWSSSPRVAPRRDGCCPPAARRIGWRWRASGRSTYRWSMPPTRASSSALAIWG
jgi:hypothetical protein